MDNDLTQIEQQKKLVEQLTKKKYQAWKLLVIGVLLGFTIYSLGKLYRSFRTYVQTSNFEWIGENVINLPATRNSRESWQMKVNENLKIFFSKNHLFFLLVYVLTWFSALILMTMGLLKYLNVRQKLEEIKEARKKSS